MRRLFILSLLFIVLAACTNHAPKQMAKANDSFDYADYHYPLDSLRAPKVFVYINDSTGERAYQLLDTAGSADEPILNTTIYDSAFFETLYYKTREGKIKMTIEEVGYKERDTEQYIKMALTRYVNDRIQSIGIPSYVTERIRPKTQKSSKMKMLFIGYFDRCDAPSGQSYYKGDDCIRLTLQNDFTPLDGPDDKKGYRFVTTHYYAKGLGQIYFEKPYNGFIQRFRLENIISLKDFENMKRVPAI